MNSAVNPFLYASYSPSFRAAFFRLTFGPALGAWGAVTGRRQRQRWRQQQQHLARTRSSAFSLGNAAHNNVTANGSTSNG